MNQMPYILIVGHGRSGTNWLLSLLDRSSETHCRNEPNELGGEPWARLPSPWVCRPYDAAVGAQWDEAVAWSAGRVGLRDHRLPEAKTHVHGWARSLGLDRMMKGPKLRRVASVAQPALAEAEWPAPRWWARPAVLAEAVAVLKLNQAPGWACWALTQRPKATVVHIIRHPGGFLNSYLNRWLAGHDRDAVTGRNRERLRQIAEVDREWAGRFGDVEAMSAEAAELWFWRYAAEMIHRTGDGRPNYHLVVYERLAMQPFEQTRRLYEACGLAWSATVEQAVREGASASRSTAIAQAWRDRLSAEHQRMIDDVLADSPLQALWPDA
ncbi:MAG: sulfotransferase [Phycisphaeraceae bacterium]